MMSMQSKIPRNKLPGSFGPVLPLVLVKSATAEEEKGMYLSFEIKTRVGQPAGSTTYQKFVQRFEEGTPQQWTGLLKDLEEI
jgi:hypothetical protein